MRIIGDVHHQNQKKYVELAQQAEYSIQVGDVGFDYEIQDLDPIRHRIIAGNHDNYEEYNREFVNQTPHFLGDFGIHSVPDFGDFFYVRGGLSIDKKNRTENFDWWPAEELGAQQANAALTAYEKAKPDFVITHECPASVVSSVARISDEQLMRIWDCRVPSSTARLLQEMLEIHRPKTWVFGHYHQNRKVLIEGTEFICLGELKFMDITR